MPFLHETKCGGFEADNILAKCWRQSHFVEIYSLGDSTGLDIFWNLDTFTLDQFFTKKWSLMAKFSIIVSSKEGYLTNFYGP